MEDMEGQEENQIIQDEEEEEVEATDDTFNNL